MTLKLASQRKICCPWKCLIWKGEYKKPTTYFCYEQAKSKKPFLYFHALFGQFHVCSCFVFHFRLMSKPGFLKAAVSDVSNHPHSKHTRGTLDLHFYSLMILCILFQGTRLSFAAVTCEISSPNSMRYCFACNAISCCLIHENPTVVWERRHIYCFWCDG